MYKRQIVQFEKLLGNIIVFINGVAGGFFCLLHRYFVGLDFLRLRHIILDFFKDFSLLFGLDLAEIFEKIIGNVPVSYTHLDVYKRQPLGYADLILNGDPEEYLKNVKVSYRLED